jgi:hypothetical protein
VTLFSMPGRLSGEFVIELLKKSSLKMSMHWVMCPGGKNMRVGNQNADTAKSPPAAMPVPGTSAFEQLRVGPSTEMSLRKT